MKKLILSAALLLPCLIFSARAADLYHNDFEKAAIGQVPADLFVIDGEFTVKEESGNKFLELPGAPLDTFGVLFGPATNSNITVGARIYGTKKGRREPTFGVGLNGQAGFKLKVSPAKGALEIYKDDAALTNAPYNWKSGVWTEFRLRVRKNGDAWKVEGKAWTQGDAEPKEWLISWDEKATPHDGKASVWGSPYSGTPIWFDDLTVSSE